jgi:hypothetical protein
MRVQTQAVYGFAHAPEVVFDLAADHENLPEVFKGVGPVPAVTAVRMRADGKVRYVENADGSVIHQQVVTMQRPTLQEFALTGGFKPPFSWLVRGGGGTWRFRKSEQGCVVRWQVYFDLRSILAFLPIKLLLERFYRQAMYDCLDAMARQLLERNAMRAPRERTERASQRAGDPASERASERANDPAGKRASPAAQALD